MREFYYFLLFILVVLLVLFFRNKVEHLTLQEVDDKSSKVLERVDVLETKLGKIETSQEQQKATMEVAADKAKEAQVYLNQPID